ncbi:SAVED domain-containing protein [Devosia elaeis]|uniref:SMODS-associated and fused to various effectors domain-containing protein n=1 Tax=Devosia elaeis TaxID=1770058 RepID=A0A178HU25_9HYPH|nr:SAVED domain-containing protein [Devosia elaeis]OAM76179.1 hypothetical protein A3840_13145 [Devosia elaeis]
MSSTSIPTHIQRALWALSAGRCQFRSCNQLLVGDLLIGKKHAVYGYVAHIIADSPAGARGHEELSRILAKDVSNLMLLCAKCHRRVDNEAPEQYPADLLRDMKREHEHRIRMATGVDVDRASHVIRFGANIGQNQALVSTRQLHEAMMPDRWPISETTIDLEIVGCAFEDHEPEYWPLQQRNLARQFQTHVGGRIERQDIRHASVFALAPQPLLIELGRQLSDILPVSVHQLHREPQTWTWQNDGPPIQFETAEPKSPDGKVALILALSATVAHDRIQRVLGEDCSIWSITAAAPHNDILRRPEDLAEFRRLLRSALNRIKAVHGEAKTINVFPALPVSAAVEVGRVWMPKADLPLRIYDQNRVLGGFAPTVDIHMTPDPPDAHR